MSSRACIDTIRSLAFGDISGTYAVVGDPLTVNPRIIVLTNHTKGDMMFSDNMFSDNMFSDNTIKDKMFLPAGSFRLIDIMTNINLKEDDSYPLPIGIQFYVRQLTPPVSGSVYIETWY